MNGTGSCILPHGKRYAPTRFAYNRHDYVQNIPEHLAPIYQLEQRHPSTCQELNSGEFAVNANFVAVTFIGLDQAQEHVNKVYKGDGAITGITTDPQAILKSRTA